MATQQKIDREIENFVRSVRSVARGETRFEHGPSTLEFAWTSACNLRCVMCGQSDNPPVMKISKQIAAPFLEKAFESAVIWNPSATSEPLLNDIDEILRLCNEKGVFLELYTNATRLTPEVFEKLAPRIHRLTLSIDTHVKNVLEAVRRPIDAERVFRHVEYAIRRCGELSIPCIINAVLMAETAPHLPAFVDWLADRGAKELTILEMLDGSSQAPAHNVNYASGVYDALGIARVADLLETARERGRARKVNLTFLLPEPFTGRDVNVEVPSRVHEALVIERFQEAHAAEAAGFCPMASHYLKVLPNGDAYPCCRAPKELKLGNVYQEGLEAVWNGAEARELRAAMYNNDPPAPCVDCLVRKKVIIEKQQKDAAGRAENEAYKPIDAPVEMLTFDLAPAAPVEK